MDGDSNSVGGKGRRCSSHRVSNAVLICGALLIVCLAFAVLGMALGLASLITQCSCDDNDDQVDRLEAQLSNLMDNPTIADLQQAVSELRQDLLLINSTQLKNLISELGELQRNLTAASVTAAETLADIQASVGSTVDELVVNVSGLSGVLTDHLESLEMVGINYISECERTEVAVCNITADPSFLPGFSICTTPPVNIQLAEVVVDVDCVRTPLSGDTETNPVVTTLRLDGGVARCDCFLVAPSTSLPPSQDVSCSLVLTTCPVATQTVIH